MKPLLLSTLVVLCGYCLSEVARDNQDENATTLRYHTHTKKAMRRAARVLLRQQLEAMRTTTQEPVRLFHRHIGEAFFEWMCDGIVPRASFREVYLTDCALSCSTDCRVTRHAAAP